jgi:hypothetical protein
MVGLLASGREAAGSDSDRKSEGLGYGNCVSRFHGIRNKVAELAPDAKPFLCGWKK